MTPESLLAVIEDFARDSRLPRPPGGLTLDTRLETELGLDSLARSELLSRIEQAAGAGLPPEALLAATPRDWLAQLDAGAARPEASATAAAAFGKRTGSAVGDKYPTEANTLPEVLLWHLERHPARPHILLEDDSGRSQVLSYAELYARAGRVAGLLQRRGLSRGQTVALLLPTGTDYFFGFFGVLLAGGIPVPLYPPARPEQLEEHLNRHARILENADSRFLLTLPEARLIARLLQARLPGLRGILTPEEAAAGDPASAPLANPRAEDLAFLQYTSGSTGDPKGVMLRHADLLANIRAMGRAIAVNSEDVFVSWLPLYHDMGLIGAWLGSLYFGLPLVIFSPLAFLARPLRWLEAIGRHRGTLSAAPNFAYELCLKRVTDADLAHLDLSSWRRAFNGAEPVSARTLERFAARFAACGLRRAALAPVYGLAEAAVGLTFPPPERGPRIDCIDRTRFATSGYALPLPRGQRGTLEVVACGRPLEGYALRVVDARGQVLPPRHEGVLQFRGPSATPGYYRRPEATALLVRDGWHDTGDRGYLAEGDLYLTGRVKDLIIRAGRNLYPYEIEQEVGDLPGLRKGGVAAFAAAEAATGSERLVVVAETREREPRRRQILERQIRERVNERLGLPPDEVLLVPPRAIPKTSSGKLRRVRARDLYLAGRLAAGPRARLWQALRLGGTSLRAVLGRRLRDLTGWGYNAYAWALIGGLAPGIWLGTILLPRLSWRWALVRGGLWLARSLTGIRLRVEGTEHWPPPGQGSVVVANHQSYLDAMVLIAALPVPLTFVAKQELAESFWLRRFLERLGTRFVARFDPRRAASEAHDLAATLEPNARMVFFPEGTFRDQPGLLPFRLGAFVVATRQALPVVPVALFGTRDRLTGDRLRLRPGICRARIGAPLFPAGGEWPDAIALREAARGWLLAATGEADLASPEAVGEDRNHSADG